MNKKFKVDALPLYALWASHTAAEFYGYLHTILWDYYISYSGSISLTTGLIFQIQNAIHESYRNRLSSNILWVSFAFLSVTTTTQQQKKNALVSMSDVSIAKPKKPFTSMDQRTHTVNFLFDFIFLPGFYLCHLATHFFSFAFHQVVAVAVVVENCVSVSNRTQITHQQYKYMSWAPWQKRE